MAVEISYKKDCKENPILSKVSQSPIGNNKRIAKNTLMLYFRMLITMGVSLYISRVVLNILGVEDFGIYNVVGGFVTMFGFLNSAMASGTQRFFAVEIGRKDNFKLRNVFSMSVNIHFLIGLGVLLIAETIGLWFVKTQLIIPENRMSASLWVYQFSIFTLFLNIISVPYNSIIIAHERMNIFAWISVIEVCLKLLFVFMLQWFGFDKLKFYAILMFGLSLIIRVIYGVYCNINFKESKFRYYWNKSLFETLISYAGWNLWGNAAGVVMGQGVNILLNIFFGPMVNAARGIAYQVRSAVNQFVFNFQMALNPQIIKSYATDDLKYMHQLIYRGSKYSFFLLYALSLPIIFETEIILKLWIKAVPNYTVIFTRLIMFNILIDCISGPLMAAAQASGRIKVYQSVVGGLLLLILPVSYIFLKLGFPPQITIIINIVISIIALIARLYILKELINISINKYLKEVILRVSIVGVISLFPLIALYYMLEPGVVRLIIIIISAIATILTASFLFGLVSSEKVFFVNKLRAILKIK